MKRILCLSGGGVRGMAQVMVLAKLEQEFGRPLYEVYDLIAGTSVGAINASLIATGAISMSELSTIYPDVIKKVFKKNRLFHKPKYDRNNFIEIWNEIVGSDFKMSDVKTKIMITSVDLVDDTNIFFKSWHENDNDEQLVDVVCRSFAAPVYFGQIVDYQNKRVYSDGGIGNSNLPLNEVKLEAEALGWYDNKGCGNKTVCIDSIGTLYNSKHHNFYEVADGRWLSQILDFINIRHGGLARAQSVKDQIRMMLYITKHNPNIKFRYWDYPARKETLILDGVKYIQYYKELGQIMSEYPLINII